MAGCRDREEIRDLDRQIGPIRAVPTAAPRIASAADQAVRQRPVFWPRRSRRGSPTGEEIDVERHALLVLDADVGLAQRIGIDRVAKNITPSLGDYLRSPPPTEIEEAAE